MKKSIFLIQDFNHLVKLTYSLADELATLHAFKLIYHQEKDLNFEEWRTTIHHTFAAIDQMIVNQCEIPFFYLGLHGCTTLEQKPMNLDQINNLLSASLKEAVDQFTQEFCAAIRTIHLYFEDDQKECFKKSFSKQEYLNEISSFCKQLVTLILGEIGLKCSDFSAIY